MVVTRGPVIGVGTSALVVALGTFPTAGCGLRSDPVLPDAAVGSSDDGPSSDPNRAGSCNDPLVLPTENARVTGALADGDSFSDAWCGSDAGPEDAYTFTAVQTGDVTITMDPSQTEFDAVVRVEEGTCGDGADALLCDRSALSRGVHFLAIAGTQYTVTIDSASGDSGGYAFDVAYGEPPLALCEVHPEVIAQVSGGSFFWSNTFSAGQGVVDGFCGGSGRENMFTLNADYPGFMYVYVSGANGFRPVVSYRTGCGGLTELSCSSDGDTGLPGVAELEVFIDAPGQYYLSIDQLGFEGGDYSLEVYFD